MQPLPADATRVMLGEAAATLIVGPAGVPAALARSSHLSSAAHAGGIPFQVEAARRPVSYSDATMVAGPGWSTPGAPAFPPLPPLSRGTMLRGRFEILKPIARGGFSYIYLGRNERNGSLVAIKEACPTLGYRNADGSVSADPAAMVRHREMLISEIVAIARASHPGVVKIEDAFETLGSIFLVMDYVEGESLAGLQARRGRLSMASVDQIGGQLLDAVAHLHSADLIHGDVKPSNVMVRPGMGTVLIDFGTSVRLSDGRQNYLVASPGYSPPERLALDSELGPWSDVYALGATLCAAISGSLPPPEGYSSTFLPPMEAGPRRDALAAALARDPAQRPQTIAEFAARFGTPLTTAAPATKAAKEECSLFISYSRRDAEIIEPLVKSLQTRGINLWIDRQGIAPGQAWAREITRGLRSARIVLVFSSSNSMASANVQDEIYLAKAENKPLVAARLDDAPFSDEVALFLTKAQHVDARGGSADDFVRDITALLNAAA